MILVFYPDKNVDDILRADQGPLTSNIETSGAGRLLQGVEKENMAFSSTEGVHSAK
jgi:hypothetical protein